MKRIICIIVFLIFQAACSNKNLQPVSSSLEPDHPGESEPSPEVPEPIRVKAWVSNPTPSVDSRIVVFGSLIKYKFSYVGGIMMSAFWPDEMAERGVPNCFTQVNYGSGKCIINVNRFPPGEFVLVTISFTYRDKFYTGQTGFTPTAP